MLGPHRPAVLLGRVETDGHGEVAVVPAVLVDLDGELLIDDRGQTERGRRRRAALMGGLYGPEAYAGNLAGHQGIMMPDRLMLRCLHEDHAHAR